MAAILTIDELRTTYNISVSDDKQLQAFLDTAEEACLALISVDIDGNVTEYFDGGITSAVLTHYPVKQVNSVEVAGFPAVYRYEQRAHKVVLQHPAPSGRDCVKITYACGFLQETPAKLKSAVALTVQQLIKLQNAKLAGVLSRTTDGGTEQIEQSVPPLAAKGLLDEYRLGIIL